MLEGIELHEANGFVVSGRGRARRARGPPPGVGRRLADAAGRAARPGRRRRTPRLGRSMEWSNALADVAARDTPAERVPCAVRRPAGPPTRAARPSQLRVRPLFARSAATGEPLALIDEELVAAGRADAEPLLAVAERLPRVRLLLLGREPARTTSTSSRPGRARSATSGSRESREPKTYERRRRPAHTRSSSASGRACCASSSAARMPTEGRPCGARRRA